MKKIFYMLCVFFMGLFLLNFDCGTPIGGSNRDQNVLPPLDTLHPKHLSNPVEIAISVTIWEYDRSLFKNVPIPGVTVSFLNNNLKDITDSNGTARSTFLIDSIPYKYGFRWEKNGYNSSERWRWDTLYNLTENSSTLLECI